MADDTSIAESGQALFCAIADFVGVGQIDKILNIKLYPTYEDFKQCWMASGRSLTIAQIFRTYIDAPGVTLGDIEKLLRTGVSGNEWYRSSVNIAVTLLKRVGEISPKFAKIHGPGWNHILYQRGDEPVMQTIANLYKVANDTQKKINATSKKKGVVFGDVNKWSPADIYLASNKSKTKLRDSLAEAKGKDCCGYTFTLLNQTICRLIADGELLPLSLKKQPKMPVTIQQVNFERQAEIDAFNQYKYYGLRPEKWIPYTGKLRANGKINPAEFRDMILYISPGKVNQMKFRHVAESTSGGTFKVEFMGAAAGTARGGSIGSPQGLANIIKIFDSGFAADWLKACKAAQINYGNAIRRPEMLKLKTQSPRTEYDRRKSNYSGVLVANVVMPMLITWFLEGSKVAGKGTGQSRTTKFIRLVFEYISSRTSSSARFVIAK